MRERRIDSEDILLVEVDAGDPTVGHEVVEQRGQRHWRGPAEPIWVRIGINDPWADNTTHPLDWFFVQYNIRPEQGMRITAYHHFPHRDTDKAVVEYDLFVVNAPKGSHIDQYDSHDELREANAAAKLKLAEAGSEGVGTTETPFEDVKPPTDVADEESAVA